MDASVFKGARVLVTGGLGFIGSNLAFRLVQLGADVTLLDAMIPSYGGNLYNIEPIKDRVRVNISDIRDQAGMNQMVREKDFIFHLAGQVSHLMSLTDPFPDIDINIKGTMVLLEACKAYNREAILVRTGTRGQYGPVSQLPVSEHSPMNPKGIYEISLLTAEKMLQVYNDIHGLRCVNLRLANIYGPRSQMRHCQYGVANWFVRLAIDGQTIQIFGDGSIRRDFVYVEDCVDALLRTAANPKAHGKVFNVGCDDPTTFRNLAERAIGIAGRGRWEFAPFPPERSAQEPGDYYSDIQRIETTVGWRPTTSLDEGLRATIDYYRAHKQRYW